MSEWISVKDRLPEADQLVLTYNQEDIEVDIYGWFGDCYDVGFLRDVIYNLNFKITHWMPLPDPPEVSHD